MTIDWTQPVIDARDMDADPLFDSQGRVQACRVGSVVYAPPAFERLGLRNVPPPKPEPVLREAWVWWNSHGRATVSLNKEWCVHQRTVERGVYAHVAVMSDGSPVPASPEQFDRMREMAKIIQERDEWKSACEQWAAKASAWSVEKDAWVDSLEEARQQRDDAWKAAEDIQTARRAVIEKMRPVVDAAVAYIYPSDVDAAVAYAKADNPPQCHHPYVALHEAVRTYQQSPKKTAAEAVANVAEMMGPVKVCRTCKWGSLPEGAEPCCNCSFPALWEPRHD